MDIEQLREICLALPGVTEDIKWGDNLCFCVADKIFLIAGLNNTPTRASFKVPPGQFNDLAATDGFGQAPYLAKNQWIITDDVNNLDAEKWQYYARQSYNLVKAKLPKKIQLQLE